MSETIKGLIKTAACRTGPRSQPVCPVTQTRTLAPRHRIAPSGFGPRVWCARWLPGSRMSSRFPAGWRACRDVLWRRISVRRPWCVQGHGCVCVPTLLMRLQSIKHLADRSHGGLFAHESDVRARVALRPLKHTNRLMRVCVTKPWSQLFSL